MTQGLAQLLTRSATDAPALRGMGASRAAAATTTAAWGAVAVAGAVLISVGGAIAASPLAPIGPVRLFDPVKGVQADWLVLGGGAAILLILLTAVLAWLAWRAVRQEREVPSARSSAVVGAVTRAGLPVTVVAGIRHALERGSGRVRAPVRATLTGSVIAVAALVAALVFGASLTGLVNHPAEYGWNWDLLIQSQGGWGSWPPGALDKTLAGRPGVTGWSELGFAQLSIRGAEVPAMGVLQHPGEHQVEPPTTSGHPLSGQNQIELGSTTMRQLGLHLGDKLRLGDDPHPLTVVGVTTLPSFGVVLTDHVSLGHGAMLEWPTMMDVLGLKTDPTETDLQTSVASPAYPATVVFDVSAQAVARKLIARMAALSAQTGSPGGTYPLPPQRGAAVVNASQMGSQPLAFAIGVAASAVLALGLDDPGVSPPASPRAGPAEVARTVRPADQGHHRLADQHDPGDSRPRRRAARRRGRAVGLDELRRFDRRRADTSRTAPVPVDRRCAPAGGGQPAFFRPCLAGRADSASRHLAYGVARLRPGCERSRSPSSRAKAGDDRHRSPTGGHGSAMITALSAAIISWQLPAWQRM